MFDNNARICNFNFGPHITHFLEALTKKRKYFELTFALKRANTISR